MLRLAILAMVLVMVLSESIYFTRYCIKYNRKYFGQERKRREIIFQKNWDYIQQHNKQPGQSYRLDQNEFTDKSDEEMSYMTGYLQPRLARGKNNNQQTADSSMTNTTTSQLAQGDWSFDWRTKTNNCWPPVRNQGQCGSCYAFSATGAIMGQICINSNMSVHLSVQNLLECSIANDTQTQNWGCGGGWMDYSFRYIFKNDGIESESTYPYTATNGTCKYNATERGATISGYTDFVRGDEQSMLNYLLTVGPISTTIYAGLKSFKSYRSGIYNDPKCTLTTSHAIVLIGAGKENGTDYWLLQNSWGPTWGMEGYMKILRGRNKCAIAQVPSAPLGVQYCNGATCSTE